MSTGPAPPSPTATVLSHGAVAVVVAALSVVAVWTVVPQVLDGALADPDAYMRLVRVERLLETGGWYDGSIPRSNAPWGEVLHWTRPLDVLLVAGAAVLRPFLGASALHVAGVVLPTVLLILTCWVVGWASVPLAGARYRLVAMAAVPVQLGIVGYALPGRPDHHALILLLFAAAAGLFLRALLEPRHAGWALGTGAVLGLSLWVGPEALVAAALVFGVGGLLWIVGAPASGPLNLRVAAGFLMAVAAALVVERPPSGWTAVEYDRISAVHLALAAVITLFWRGVAPRVAAAAGAPGLGEGRGAGGASFRRGGGALAFGALALAGLTTLFPGFLRGPTADVDPIVMDVWLRYVSEFGAFLWPRSGRDVGMLIATLGPALFCIPVAVRRAARRWGEAEGPAWVFLALGLVGFTGLTLLRGRFLGYPQVLFVLVTAAFLADLHRRIAATPSPRWVLAARPLLTVALVVGPFLAGVAVMAAVSPGASPAGVAPEGPGLAADDAGVCPGQAVTDLLGDPAGLGDRPRVVLAPRDLGPEILYRTPHAVVATPYHRNTRGLLDQRAILLARDPAVSLAGLRERGVELVLVCGGGAGGDEAGPRDGADASTFLDRLRSGSPVPGLRRLETAEARGLPGFTLWMVESGEQATRPR